MSGEAVLAFLERGLHPQLSGLHSIIDADVMTFYLTLLQVHWSIHDIKYMSLGEFFI